MNRSIMKSLSAALLSLGLAISAIATVADDTAMPSEPEAQSVATESVQPQIEKESADKMIEKRQQILAEATAAVAETEKALAALEQGKTDDALSALAVATGKLELILVREPALALAPVNVEIVTIDLLSSAETVEAVIKEAEELLKKGEIQKARPLIANLASEIVFRTTSIPLVTYPAAIKAITPLIDAGKLEEAKEGLQAALNTLVVTTDDVIPLPKLRAESLLDSAEKLASNEERTVNQNERLADLLKEARSQLKMAELLGYGTKKSYKPIYEQLDQIESKTVGGKSGKGWFDKIKQQLEDLV